MERGRGQRVPGGDRGGMGRPSPFLPRPRPGAKSPALRRGAGLQRRFEEIRVPRTLARAGGSGGRAVGKGRGTPGSRAARGGSRKWTPKLGPPPRGRLFGTPQGLALSPPGLRLFGASSRPPQPRVPPLPGSSAPFIFPRLRLGFCWFLGDKNRLK